MAMEMECYLPRILGQFASIDAHFITIKKSPDLFLLSDLIGHFGPQRLACEHIGWLVNSILHLSCYLDWHKLTHNCISLDTLFVSPDRHSVALLGGWWYATAVGNKYRALPNRTLALLSPEIFRTNIASTKVDLELVKALARESLLDLNGSRVLLDYKITSALRQWLNLPSSGRARTDYAEWKYAVLPDSFGEAKFVEMNLSKQSICKE
jgi:hypothetical protein